MGPIAGGVCSVCSERLWTPYALDAGEARCGLCRRAAPPFVRAVAYGSYDHGLRELIHLLKYERVLSAAAALGTMLAQALTRLEFPAAQTPPLVVPVPLHARKLRQRGFNQSEMIAREALKRSRAGLRLLPQVLVRQRETHSQTGLTRHQRRQNLRGAFVVLAPREIAGRDVILVDDVFTTGTTVSECARVLRRAGASNVYVATVARTLKAEGDRVRFKPARVEEDDPVAAAG